MFLHRQYVRKWIDIYYWQRWILKKLLHSRGIKDAFNVLDEQWDYLIILDACRYDAFLITYKKHGLEGKLERRVTLGGDTLSWLKGNFGNCKCNDIVYVTANPFVDMAVRNNFYKVLSVWKYAWDPKNGTVLPEDMYRYALYAISKYPEKRLIIHFMQPHYPYIGTGVTSKSLEDLRRNVIKGSKTIPNSTTKKKLTAYYFAEIYSMFSEHEMRIEYMKNLHMVLPYVKRLIDVLPGKVVVSSDHGEAMGERPHLMVPIRLYGHNDYIGRVDPVIVVPWFVAKSREPKVSLEGELKRVGIGRIKLRLRLHSKN